MRELNDTEKITSTPECVVPNHNFSDSLFSEYLDSSIQKTVLT